MEAKIILNEFSWGPEFLNINQEILDLYQNCNTSDEIIETQVS